MAPWPWSGGGGGRRADAAPPPLAPIAAAAAGAAKRPGGARPPERRGSASGASPPKRPRPPLAARRLPPLAPASAPRPFDPADQISSIPKHVIRKPADAAAAAADSAADRVARSQRERITAYFKAQMKPLNGLKKDAAERPDGGGGGGGGRKPNGPKSASEATENLEKYIAYLANALNPKVLLCPGNVEKREADSGGAGEAKAAADGSARVAADGKKSAALARKRRPRNERRKGASAAPPVEGRARKAESAPFAPPRAAAAPLAAAGRTEATAVNDVVTSTTRCASAPREAAAARRRRAAESCPVISSSTLSPPRAAEEARRGGGGGGATFLLPQSSAVVLTAIRIPRQSAPPRPQFGGPQGANGPADFNGQFVLPFVQNLNGTLVQIPNLMTKMNRNILMTNGAAQSTGRTARPGDRHQMLLNGTLLKFNSGNYPQMPNLVAKTNDPNVSYDAGRKNLNASVPVVVSKSNYPMALNHPLLVPSPAFILNSLPLVTTQAAAMQRPACSAAGDILFSPSSGYMQSAVNLTPCTVAASPPKSTTFVPILPRKSLNSPNSSPPTTQSKPAAETSTYSSLLAELNMPVKRPVGEEAPVDESRSLVNENKPEVHLEITPESLIEAVINSKFALNDCTADSVISRQINDNSANNSNKTETDEESCSRTSSSDDSSGIASASSSCERINADNMSDVTSRTTSPCDVLSDSTSGISSELSPCEPNNNDDNLSDNALGIISALSPCERTANVDTLLDNTSGLISASSPSTVISKEEEDSNGLTVSVNSCDTPIPSQKSPILSQPKTIRFPAKQHNRDLQSSDRSNPRRSTDNIKTCQWDYCDFEFEFSSELLEHLQEAHVNSQTTRETYVCLWAGCKVKGRTSCSRLWLERHALSHGGSKPFRCIVDQCGKRFNTQLLLQRHVNSHFQQSPSVNNVKKSAEGSASKLLKRNGRKLRFRRQPWSARVFDFFDAGIIEGLQHRLLMWAGSDVGVMGSGSEHCLRLGCQIIARRKTANNVAEALVTYTPRNILEDEWIPEKDVCPAKEVFIKDLSPSSKTMLHEHFTALPTTHRIANVKRIIAQNAAKVTSQPERAKSNGASCNKARSQKRRSQGERGADGVISKSKSDYETDTANVKSSSLVDSQYASGSSNCSSSSVQSGRTRVSGAAKRKQGRPFVAFRFYPSGR